VDWKLELVLVPVSDVDRAKDFYVERCGFRLDVDHQAGEHFRVVQMTPRGSACSISVGIGITSKPPGSAEGLHLIVTDIEAARAELLSRGVEASEIQVFDERDGGTIFGFADPDGNTWAVQQLKVRAEKPLIPREDRGRFGEGVEL
jgi:catechol 2,3-dioxygenase-like lactoylglutathione lyase family enzyme